MLSGGGKRSEWASAALATDAHGFYWKRITGSGPCFIPTLQGFMPSPQTRALRAFGGETSGKLVLALSLGKAVLAIKVLQLLDVHPGVFLGNFLHQAQNSMILNRSLRA